MLCYHCGHLIYLTTDCCAHNYASALNRAPLQKPESQLVVPNPQQEKETLTHQVALAKLRRELLEEEQAMSAKQQEFEERQRPALKRKREMFAILEEAHDEGQMVAALIQLREKRRRRLAFFSKHSKAEKENELAEIDRVIERIRMLQ